MAASPQQSHRKDGRIMNRINNAIAFLIVAAVFAMIGIESGAHHSPTHSGTQQVVEVRK
jgi:hypothetical protein